MFARNATLPDAIAIEQLIQIHVGDGTLLGRSLAEICENIRDFVVIEARRRSRRLRRAAPLRYALGRSSLHHHRQERERKGRGAHPDRRFACRSGAAERYMRMLVYPHSGVLRQDGVHRRGEGIAARQDVQRLSALPAAACLRRDCDVHGRAAGEDGTRHFASRGAVLHAARTDELVRR